LSGGGRHQPCVLKSVEDRDPSGSVPRRSSGWRHQRLQFVCTADERAAADERATADRITESQRGPGFWRPANGARAQPTSDPLLNKTHVLRCYGRLYLSQTTTARLTCQCCCGVRYQLHVLPGMSACCQRAAASRVTCRAGMYAGRSPAVCSGILSSIVSLHPVKRANHVQRHRPNFSPLVLRSFVPSPLPTSTVARPRPPGHSVRIFPFRALPDLSAVRGVVFAAAMSASSRVVRSATAHRTLLGAGS